MGYSQILGNWLQILSDSSLNSKEKSQKSLELHHTASFILSMTNERIIENAEDLKITGYREEPDIALMFQGKSIGLELTRVTNSRRDFIGFQKSLIRKAEAIVKQKYPEIKLHCNIAFNQQFDWTTTNTNDAKTELANYIVNTHNDVVSSMPMFLRRIRAAKHSCLTFSLMGGYSVGDLHSTTILEEIQHKEVKFPAYVKQNDFDEVWLLLIINGASPESDYNNIHLPIGVPTQFRHVYLLNDFEKKVFKIK